MMQQTGHPDRPWAPVRLRSAVRIEKDGQILLVHDPVYRGGCWTLPGGGVEFEEKFVPAAEREVFEETGLTVKVHSLWHIREIWEPEPDYPDELALIRRSLELILIGDYVSGTIDIGKNPSRKPDGIPRVKECRWFPLEGLGPTIDKVPIYPAELFDPRHPVKARRIPLKLLMLPPLDLRGG
jgi:8-oxo-dGTP pyrophosphatase MutT (NUDIX family)